MSSTTVEVPLRITIEIGEQSEVAQIDRDPLGNVRRDANGRVRFLKLNEGIRVSRLMQDWATKLQSIESGNAPASPKKASDEGVELLRAALATHHGTAPPALAVPVPIEHPKALPASRARGGFPRPD